jgi:hypothetical protein
MREVVDDFIFNDAPTDDDVAEATAKGRMIVVIIPNERKLKLPLSDVNVSSSYIIVYEYRFFGVDNYEDAKAEFLRRIRVMQSDEHKEWYAPAGTKRGVIKDST